MKFNILTKGRNIIRNCENEKSYNLSPQWQLYVAVLTSSLNDKFYEKSSDRLKNICGLIAKNDPLFIAQLAVYARREMNLRTMPLVIAVELAKIHNGDALVSRLISNVVLRADEITELLAYYQQANAREGTKKLNRLSKQVQAGLQISFNNFDEYQFAKYNRETEIKLRDALFLVHPKAKDDAQQVIFNKIISNSLQRPYTWETELSALGQTTFRWEKDKQVAFTLKWEELINSGKLGYMALMRNLRNILEANVSKDHLIKVCDTLSSEKAVLHSKQLPFRFLAAYREISKVKSKYAGRVLDALEEAVKVSARNIKGFENSSVLIACDVSGSMQQPISPKSTVLNYDIGLMLAMLLKSRCRDAITGMFGNTWKIINVPTSGVLSNVNQFYHREGEVGYATNGYLVIEDLIKRSERVDKIMMFTDCQLWNNRNTGNIAGAWKKYKKISPGSKLYLFDLAGYGNTPLDITQKDVYLIAGWSDKIFDILSAIDKGGDALSEIRKTVLL